MTHVETIIIVIFVVAALAVIACGTYCKDVNPGRSKSFD